MKWVERVGALHAHSRFSDGQGSLEDLLQASRLAGLDFLVLTDHDTMAAAREGWEGRRDGVVLLVAAEITPRKQGHVLAMKVHTCAGYAAQHNRNTLDAIARQGGYALVAHPMGKHKPTLRITHVPWYGWDHPAIRGLEIWSYMHDWIDEVAWWRLPQAYEFWKHHERRVRGPHREIMKQWDETGRTRRLAGLGGLDAHAYRVPLSGALLFPYERMFRSLRNHLLIDGESWAKDPISALWDAHAEGRGFVSHDYIGDAAGARCESHFPDGRVIQMGEEAPFVPGITMTLRLPRAAEVSWIADGRPRLLERADILTARPAGPGVYRFEAQLDGRPWLFTNPFYLR